MYVKIDIGKKGYQPKKIPEYVLNLKSIIDITHDIDTISIIREGLLHRYNTYHLEKHTYENSFNSEDFDDSVYDRYETICSDLFYLKNLYETISKILYEIRGNTNGKTNWLWKL